MHKEFRRVRAGAGWEESNFLNLFVFFKRQTNIQISIISFELLQFTRNSKGCGQVRAGRNQIYLICHYFSKFQKICKFQEFFLNSFNSPEIQKGAGRRGLGGFKPTKPNNLCYLGCGLGAQRPFPKPTLKPQTLNVQKIQNISRHVL